jgi:hypothetical protein
VGHKNFLPDDSMQTYTRVVFLEADLRVFTVKETNVAPPPRRLFGSKRNINAPKAYQKVMKWESFTDESFKFKQSSRDGTTTNAQDIHLSRVCLIRAGILLFSSTILLELKG